MNLLMVFAFAGDSTMTRFLAILERRKLHRPGPKFRTVRAADDITALAGDAKLLRTDRRSAGVIYLVWRRLLVLFLVADARLLVLLRLVVERLVRDTEDVG